MITVHRKFYRVDLKSPICLLMKVRPKIFHLVPYFIRGYLKWWSPWDWLQKLVMVWVFVTLVSIWKTKIEELFSSLILTPLSILLLECVIECLKYHNTDIHIYTFDFALAKVTYTCVKVSQTSPHTYTTTKGYVSNLYMFGKAWIVSCSDNKIW